jgi:LPS export ABC transporter protein LptC
MLKRKYLWFILILILSIGLSFYYIYNKRRDSSFVQTKEEIEETEEVIIVNEAPVKIEQGIVVGMKEGKKEWEIEADRISLAKDRKKTIFEQINKMVIFKDDEPNLNIQLNQCIADMGSKSMELVGDVVIETREGDILKGDRFFWDSREETLNSLDSVEVMVKENKITADQLYTDSELNNLELAGNVKVTFKID